MSRRTALVLRPLSLVRPAAGGPGHTALPTFARGQPAQALYTALGVIKSNNLEIDVVGSSLEATAAPGRTVTSGTAGTAVLHQDATKVFNTAGSGIPDLRNGSGRVVASPNVFSMALVADNG
ncbi:MAG TPA: hypothetical protein VE911_08425 [Candidatus Nitrosopolaris sp.]|nr:hypothetical protein [Candidatus Nitrosopolaris sp.]